MLDCPVKPGNETTRINRAMKPRGSSLS